MTDYTEISSIVSQGTFEKDGFVWLDLLYLALPEQVSLPEHRTNLQKYLARLRSPVFQKLLEVNFNAAFVLHLSDLPPYFALAHPNCNTPDRKEYWEIIKNGYQYLFLTLKAHFTGMPKPVFDIPEKDQKYIELWRDDYLSLYALIQDGWEVINNHALKFNRAKIQQTPLVLPSTPGELLLIIMTIEANYQLLQAYPENLYRQNYYSEFSPRKMYTETKERRKLEALEKTDKLSKIQSQKLESSRRKDREGAWNSGELLRQFCVTAVERSKPGKKTTLRRQLARYNKIHAEFKDLELSFLHPSERPKGWKWNKGQRQNN